MRSVPPSIVRPEYADSGAPASCRTRHILRTRDQYERMTHACRTAREVLELVLAAVEPGVTTEHLDALAHEETLRRGAYPSPLNYHGFPKSICTSVNEVICHGIPDDNELQDGDIVNCDVTVYIDGMHGDCSETVCVGATDEQARELARVTEEAMYAAIETVRSGSKLREIGRAIEAVAAGGNYGVVRAFVGHGLGKYFHMDPQVPHYYDSGVRATLERGMTFTTEPMINLGTWEHELWSDEWTAVTADLQWSAQFEHTVLVTDRGPEILTLPDGRPQPFL